MTEVSPTATGRRVLVSREEPLPRRPGLCRDVLHQRVLRRPSRPRACEPWPAAPDCAPVGTRRRALTVSTTIPLLAQAWWGSIQMWLLGRAGIPFLTVFLIIPTVSHNPY